MRKAIFIFIISVLLLHAKCVAQNNTVYGAGISYTNGVPTFVPPSKSARVAIDTVTSKWYEYATPGGWRWSGDRVQDISGCSAPAYTPGKAQSRLVLNACSVAQNGHGPELYKYTGSAWLCLNCGGNYTAGDGIDITGTEITNTAPDQIVTISGATGSYPNFTIPSPAVTLNDLTDVTLSSPTNTQVLQYNSATTQWVNATLAGMAGSIANGQVAFGSGTAIAGTDNLYWNGSELKIGSNTSYNGSLLSLVGATKSGISVYVAPVSTLGVYTLQSLELNGAGLTGGAVGYNLFDINLTGNPTASGNRSYFRFMKNGTANILYSMDTRGELTHRPIGLGGFGSVQYDGVNAGGPQFGYFRATNCQSGVSFRNAIVTDNGTGVGFRFSVTSNTAYNAITNLNAKILTFGVSQNSGDANYEVGYIKANGDTYTKGVLSVGTTSPATGAAIQVSSTTGVMVPPNMTSTQRDAIASPPNGIIYNTTTGKFQGYAAGAWVDFH